MIITTPIWDISDYIYHMLANDGMSPKLCNSDELLFLENCRIDPKTVRLQFNVMVFHHQFPKEGDVHKREAADAYSLLAKKNLMLRRKILLGFQKL